MIEDLIRYIEESGRRLHRLAAQVDTGEANSEWRLMQANADILSIALHCGPEHVLQTMRGIYERRGVCHGFDDEGDEGEDD